MSKQPNIIEMMFYELDYLVWSFHQRWTFDDTYPEIVGKYFFLF